MHKPNLILLADTLDAELPLGATFDMRAWISMFQIPGAHAETICGTVACIAGTAALLASDAAIAAVKHRDYPALYRVNVSQVAQDWLELSGEQSADLFAPMLWNMMGVEYRNVTAQHAARVVRHLIATGEVDWTVADLPVTLPNAQEETA